MNPKSHTLTGRNNISKGLSNSDKLIGRRPDTITSEDTKNKMSIAASGRVRLDLNAATEKFIEMYPDAIISKYPLRYDFTTADGLKTVVKSSTLSKSGKNWNFSMSNKRNKTVDTISLFAFDNPKDKNLLFIWIVPAEEISHLTGIAISIGTLPKWNKWLVYRNEEYYENMKFQDETLIEYWTNTDNQEELFEIIKSSDAHKKATDKMRGGDDIVNHHYIYDHANPEKYTTKMTRAKHTQIHGWLRGADIKVPHINVTEKNKAIFKGCKYAGDI